MTWLTWGSAGLVLLLSACAVDDRLPSVTDEQGTFDGAGSGQGGAVSTVVPPPGGAAGQTSAPVSNGGAPGSNGGGAGANGGAAMAESSPPPAAGGSGAGAGGSAAGSSGECVAGSAGCNSAGVALSPVQGRVTAASNGLGVNGEFYVASDGPTGGPSTVSSSFAGSDVCIQGVAGPVSVDSGGLADYAGDWGVAVGLNLAQQGAVRGPWSTSTSLGTVVGFSFVITGAAIPATLRFNVASPDGTSQYCALANAQSGISKALSLEELATECWSVGAGVTAPAEGPFGNVEWNIPTVTDEAIPFDFCISDLQGIVE